MMETKGVTFFKVLCNRFHPSFVEGLFPPGFEDLKKLVQDNKCSSKEPAAIFEPAEATLSRVHYSWLVPLMQKMDAAKHDLLISALPETQAKGLLRMMKKDSLKMKWTPSMKDWIQKQVLKDLKPQEQPLAFLSESLLAPLLAFNKEQLVQVIECLGIYDLSEEIRKIVDRHRLKLIYAALNPLEQKFLRQCLQFKTRLQSFGMDLHNWSGSIQELKMQLHRRGMARLGRALSGQEPQFVWRVIHTLDIGRGSRVSKWVAPDPKEGVTTTLVGQLLNVINFIQKSEP